MSVTGLNFWYRRGNKEYRIYSIDFVGGSAGSLKVTMIGVRHIFGVWWRAKVFYDVPVASLVNSEIREMLLEQNVRATKAIVAFQEELDT